ncbi:MAG TPA: hypothetical protein VN723_04985 [Rhizomicrobium sp.]|jgi:hypothetical protein|nr:hypothetical protein [Rhizomicrobium sp.]
MPKDEKSPIAPNQERPLRVLDDQADDMVKETEAMAVFDRWVANFVAHVLDKGVMPDIKDDERAETTTNRDKKKAG